MAVFKGTSKSMNTPTCQDGGAPQFLRDQGSYA